MSDRDILDLEHFVPYRLSVLSNRISHDIAAREVAERTAMDKVAVSRAIASLLDAGRIERDIRDDDRRRSRLRLSPEGRAIYDEVAPLALAYQRRLLEGLAEDERAALDRLLTRLETLELATRD